MRRIDFSIIVFILVFAMPGLNAATFPDFWLTQSSRWPAAEDNTIVAPPANAELRFRGWAEELLPEAIWQKIEIAKVPYLRGWGYLHSYSSPTARLQMRIVMTPVYPGAQQFVDGAVLHFDFITPQTVPESSEKMLALLEQYINPQRLTWPTDPRYAQPTFWREDGQAGYALPNDFYAITNGKELRVASFVTPNVTRPKSILDRLGSGSDKAAKDGSLNYLLPPEMANPWLVLAALDWPAWPANNEALASAPEGAEAAFLQQLQLTLREEWQPKTPINYLKKNGFVHVTSEKDIRLRARMAVSMQPKITRVLLLAVELPEKYAAATIGDMLGEFVSTDLLTAPALDNCPIEIMEYAGGKYYSHYRQEDDGRIPLDIFAWSDGKILLIAMPESYPAECATCAD